ncbi:flagellar basal body rod protein [Amphibacillus sp. MSJ-3]|uniref:lmo0954 family membrane protein n=1 Tax=Amphibacillus sp. MSJ-3 TaxID=2841505 RepID=UPI001C0F2EA9|nr:flagellar basal body rod protein [Amphibacillus sp. MSJ-3]MBU5593919.1 flagellar basal body rod protein [Amphibacillus sp. MSJ-3]
MRLFILFIVTIVAGMIILVSVAPLIGLFLTLAIVYYSARRFLLTESLVSKVGWGILGLIGLSMSLSNTPAIVGVAAVILLYYAYSQYKRENDQKEDPDWMID